MKMGTRRKKVEEEPSDSLSEDDDRCSENEGVEAQADDYSRYEQARDQRIKENMDRMHKLGLLDLSLKLKPPKKNKNPLPKKKKTTIEPSHSPQRRSSRIMCLTPINYSEKSLRNSESKDNDEVEIFIPEGTNPEVYTEEQEKLLGDCETAWELYVDGYDEDGNRIYDPIKGETCHQCRYICKYHTD